MKILIIGGTGFISGYLSHQLAEAGHTVSLLTRGLTTNPVFGDGNITYLRGDRTDERSLRNAAEESTYDVVYDMIAYRPEETESAVRVFRGRIGRFIHCSTISVYMISDHVRCPITEDQDNLPVMPFWDRNPFGMEYGILKRQCEDLLWSAHDEKLFPVSMLRPTYVCGPNDPMRRDYFWMQRLLDRKPVLVPGSGDHVFHPVYAGDVARAFIALTEHENSVGEAYTVAGGEVFSLNEYLRRLAAMLDVQPKFFHLPQHLFDSLKISTYPGADVFPFNVRRTAIFNIEKIKKDLRYEPTPFDTWMNETIGWYRSSYTADSPGYEFRSAEVDIVQTYSGIINKANTKFKQTMY
jgi:nucleoside-diphosphate-sugar epimerase